MIDRFERAKNLVADQFWITEMAALQDSMLNQIANSSEDDERGRERFYLKLKVLKEIQAHFESVAATDRIVKKRWKVL